MVRQIATIQNKTANFADAGARLMICIDHSRRKQRRGVAPPQAANAAQAASGLAMNAAALVTHDRDFLRMRSQRITS
jgi:hypothetical protein